MINKQQKCKEIGGVINDVDSLFKEFIVWSTMTDQERRRVKIPNAKSFAKKHCLHESQLSRWKQRSDFQDLKMDQQRNRFRDLTPNVLWSFYQRCLRYGASNDVEFWLNVIEGFDKKKIFEKKTTITFGEGDIRALIANLTPEKQHHYRVMLAKLLSDVTVARDKRE